MEYWIDLKKEIMDVHKYLDQLGVPRKDPENTYSLLGRIKHMHEAVVFTSIIPINNAERKNIPGSKNSL